MRRLLFIILCIVLSRTEAWSQTKPTQKPTSTTKTTTTKPTSTTTKPTSTTTKPTSTTTKPTSTTTKPTTSTTTKPTTSTKPTSTKPTSTTTTKPSTTTKPTTTTTKPTTTTTKPTTTTTTKPATTTTAIDEGQTVYFCWLNPGTTTYNTALNQNSELKRVALKVTDNSPLDDISTLGEDGEALDPLPCFAPDIKIIYKTYTYVISSICAKAVKFKNKIDFVPSTEVLPLDVTVTDEFLQKLTKTANLQFGIAYRTQVAQASKPILAKIPSDDHVDTDVDLGDDNDDVDVPDYDIDFSDDYDPELDDFGDLDD